MPPMLRAGMAGGISFPNALTTGPAAGGYNSLTPVAGATYEIEAGHSGSWPSWVQTLGDGSQLVEGIAFGAGTSLFVTVADFALAGCSMIVPQSATGGIVFQGGGTLTTAYCTIGAQNASSPARVHEGIDGDGAGTLIIDHCNLYWWEQAVHSGTATTITNSYIHDPVFAGGDHTECIEINAHTNVTVTGCTLLNSLPQTAVIAGASNPSSYTASGNLIGGGGYSFYSYTSAGSVVITGNYLTTAYYPQSGNFGVMTGAPSWGSNGNVWSGNYWYDGPSAGQLISAP